MSRLAQVLDYLNNPFQYAAADANTCVDPKTGLMRSFYTRPLTAVVPELKFLSNGYFSDAYLDTTTNTVIKIVRGHVDKAYASFVEAARAKPMPALPQFYNVIPLREGRQTVYHMEYLPYHPDAAYHQDLCNRVTQAILTGRPYTQCPNVQDALEYLGTQNLNDTSHRNFGWRDKKQLVLLDPTSVWYELGKMYWGSFRAVGGFGRAVENKDLRFRYDKPIRPHDHLIGRENRAKNQLVV
jgi:hypothetical protein